MRVKQVQLQGFKGLNDTRPVDHLNYIVGPNGSGKTALLEAIQYACEGRTSLGDKPDSVAPMMGLAGGATSVSLDNGRTFGRGLSIDHDAGTTNSTITVDGKSMPVRTGHAMIAEAIGKDGSVFAPMFDLDRFLELSDDKRRDYVLDLCARAQSQGAGDAIRPAPLGARITLGFLKQQLGAGTVATNLDRKDATEFLLAQLGKPELEAWLKCEAELVRVAHKGTPAETISAALDTAKTIMNGAKRAKDEAHSANRHLAEQIDAFKVPAETVEALKEARQKVVADRTALLEQSANQAGRSSARAAMVTNLEKLRAKLHELNNQTAPALPEVEIAERLEAEADRLENDKGGVVFDLESLEANEQQARQDADQARLDHSEAMDKVRQAKVDAERVQLALDAASNDDWLKMDHLLNDYEALVPPVKTVAMQWAAIREFVSARRKSIDVAELEAKMQEAGAAFQLANNQYEAASSILATAKDALRQAQESLARVRTMASAQAATITEHQRQARYNREQARKIRDAIASADANEQARKTARDYIADQVIVAEAQLNGLDSEGGFIPPAELTAQIVRLDFAEGALSAQISAKEKYQHLRDEYTQCVANAEKQAVLWEVAKKVVEAIKVLREELMEEMIRPLIDHMREFLRNGLVPEYPYCALVNDNGKPIFELGLERGDRRIAYPAMSGGERVLFGAALAYALVQLADPPLKLLMVEAAEADVETIEVLMDCIGGVRDNLSNAMLATCHAHCEAVPDWHVIDLFPTEDMD